MIPPGLPTVAPVPSPAPAVPPRPTVRGLHATVRERLALARALERVPPEEYGFDLTAAARIFTVTGWLYRRYFRVACEGLERLPVGRFLLVANHGSHALAWDGANIITAALLDADPPRLVHAMADHRLMQLPILGCAARRIGAVDGRRAPCIRLLRAGGAVLTFPEGARVHERPFRARYRLGPFGHGFVRVAMVTQTPIVPVAVVGAEEEAPLLANPRWLRKLVRTHSAPVTPTLVVPLPVRYRIFFGEPIRLPGPPTTVSVVAGVRAVREAIARQLAAGLEARRHLFW